MTNTYPSVSQAPSLPLQRANNGSFVTPVSSPGVVDSLTPTSMASQMVSVSNADANLFPTSTSYFKNKILKKEDVMKIERLQAIYRGNKVRSQICVRTLEQGLIFSQIKGGKDIFERTGLEGAFADNAEKMELAGPASVDKSPVHQQVAWFSVNPRYFTSRIVAVSSLVNLVDLSKKTNYADLETTLYINGGFFNNEKYYSEFPESTPIGKFVFGGQEILHIPHPQQYAGDYKSIQFGDGSCAEFAPVLSGGGKPKLMKAVLSDPAYCLPKGFSFEKGDKIPPGFLLHAAYINPRAGISIPQNSLLCTDKTIRLVTGVAEVRNENGYSLSSWSKIMARLDRLDSPPNFSMNLDGGYSVTMFVKQANGNVTMVTQDKVGRPVATFIEFSRRKLEV